MLTVAAFVVCLGLLRLAGHDLRRLAGLRLRHGGLALVALAVQTVIVSIWTGGSPGWHEILHVGSYLLLGWVLLANRSVPGIWLLGTGVASNAAAIIANHGVMPASRRALAAAGFRPSAGFANSGLVAHPRLAALGDVLATPRWLPLHNVVSVGDVLIVAGALLVAWRATGPGGRAAGGHTVISAGCPAGPLAPAPPVGTAGR